VKRLKQHSIWGRRGTFILAATGSAVGLGNIWKFPYITGENGGGAFVLMYLVCVALVGVPIMIAEILIGRHARANPIMAMQKVTHESGRFRGWNIIGWLGVTAAFLILSYYSVIAGWTLEYLSMAFKQGFVDLDGSTSAAIFDDLLANKSQLAQWQTIFVAMTAMVLVFGVNKGLEQAVRIMMPLLFLLLLLLLGYAAYAGDFIAGLKFLFSFNVGDLSWNAALVALGHAFFTLSLGMGTIMAYGAYMPSRSSIGKTAITVALLDTTVALVAGLAIFPLVFATPDISPGEGPGLMFVTLPIAFGSMPLGAWFGGAFFLLVVMAAWSSTISLLEPAVAYFTERFGFHRISACLLIAGCAWLLGLCTVFSFNDWTDFNFIGEMNFFESIDFVTTNIMLPLGGLLTAIFVGWFIKHDLLRHELQLDSRGFFQVWQWLLRYISPLAVLAIFIAGLYPFLHTFFGSSDF
jgi:NSS family neurotransmitter:Na+ symporter